MQLSSRGELKTCRWGGGVVVVCWGEAAMVWGPEEGREGRAIERRRGAADLLGELSAGVFGGSRGREQGMGGMGVALLAKVVQRVRQERVEAGHLICCASACGSSQQQARSTSQHTRRCRACCRRRHRVCRDQQCPGVPGVHGRGAPARWRPAAPFHQVHQGGRGYSQACCPARGAWLVCVCAAGGGNALRCRLSM